MDVETLKWIRVIHLFGMLTWAGSLVGLSFILRQHSRAAEAAYSDFIALEKGTAIAMDIGALLTIVCGFAMLFSIHPSPLKSGGWMHAKLLLVAILFAVHGFQRMRVGKFKRGKVSANPGWVIPVIELAVLGIIILVAAKPF